MISVLSKRADFLSANRGLRIARPGFVLLVNPNSAEQVRFGITVTKKIGNAVLRNRAKRRLRALARDVLAPCAVPGWDYVLVARPEATVSRPYADMCTDLRQALGSVHRGREGGRT